MTKTTVYLPDDLKAGIEREARRQGLSEAEVIRRAITAAITAPRPTPAILDGDPFADHADQLLDGFGQR